MSKPKICITGSCGFIASNFVRKLLREDKYDVISLDKVSLSSLMNNIYIHKSHQFYLADITDEHIIDRIFEYEKPNIVVHMAASTHVDASLLNPNEFIKNNVLGTQILVNAAVKWGVGKFILSSTDEVFGQLTSENDGSWTEESPTNPRNYYSSSKMASELIVNAANNAFGLNYNITRSCNNYGPRQTSDKFIPKIIKSILEDKEIPVYGKGLQIRDWIHTFDNCSALLKIIESGNNNEIYNISANQEFSNIEVVQIICNIMNKGWDLINFVEDRKGHDFRYSINADKIRSLGWEPNFKFKTGITNCIEWYLNNTYFLR